MIRTAIIALALTLALPRIALAQLYDSGWSRIAVGDLEQLELNGGGIRVNNFLVHPEQRSGRQAPPEEALRTFLFSASTIRQQDKAREVFIQVIGMRENGTPTLSTAGRATFNSTGGRQAQQVQSRSPASAAEMAETQSYFVRIIVQ